MWQDNALSAYLVLALGNWLGGVTKGVTGFGSAILNLCCWIACVVAGVNSGSLQQAVVTEALSSTLMAPGLLYVTRAHATADFKMVAAIALFVGLSSPIGAAALAHWDAKLIELVMAAALLVIILAEQLSKLIGWYRAAPACPAAASDYEYQAVQDVEGQQQQQQQQQKQYTGAYSSTAGVASQDVEADGSSSSSDSSSDSGSSEGLCQAVNAGDCTVCVVDAGSVPAGVAADVSKITISNAGSWQGPSSMILPVVSPTAPAGAAAAAAAYDQHHDSDLWQPLLEAADNGADDASAEEAVRSSTAADGSDSRQRGCVAEWLAVLGIGAVAGTASGIMEGLTGMNGPPIMICYRLRNTPKATVRGNNAILNLLQMRLIPYYFMGLIVARDLQLYAVTCAAGVAGAVVGDMLSQRMCQKTFQACLGVLMVLCCALMFASGLGFV